MHIINTAVNNRRAGRAGSEISAPEHESSSCLSTNFDKAENGAYYTCSGKEPCPAEQSDTDYTETSF